LAVIGAVRRVYRASRIAAVVLALSPLLPGAAQDRPAAWQTPWTGLPAIAVLGRSDDPRVPLARDAVAYWNRNFAEIGTHSGSAR